MSSLLQASSAFLREFSRPYAEKLNLTALSPRFDVVVYSGLFFTLSQHVIVPALSKLLTPKSYGSLKGRSARNKWANRGVSMIHALIVVPLAVRSLNAPGLAADRAFGWDDQVGLLNAIATGYFVWDSIDAIVTFESLGFVLHGVACTGIYLLSFRPFLGYYAARCLLWETSTIFLNIHWLLDKTSNTGSRTQMINGLFLLSSFSFIRILYGGHMSYEFFKTLLGVRDQIPATVFALYGGGNLLLQGLNWFWFYSMINALRKRFKGADNGRSRKPKLNGNGNGHAVNK